MIESRKAKGIRGWAHQEEGKQKGGRSCISERAQKVVSWEGMCGSIFEGRLARGKEGGKAYSMVIGAGGE